MYNTPMQLYKQTEFAELTTREVTLRLLKQCLNDIKLGVAFSIPRQERIQYLSTAQQIIYVIQEHLNAELPEEEFFTMFNVLSSVNNEINKLIKERPVDREELLNVIHYLIDIIYYSKR